MHCNLIIDCHFLCWKAFHTTGSLSFEDIPTGVVFGFLNQIRDVWKQFKPCDFIFCWDSRKSVRKQQYAGYKDRTGKALTEKEKEQREAAVAQMTLLRKWVLPSFGFHKHFLLPGFEADDIIAKWCIAHQNEMNVIISADEDLYQLLDYAAMYNPTKRKKVTAHSFTEKYGILPSQWAEIKALAGCSSDNVKGVKGIGETNALAYVKGELAPSTAAWRNIEENTTTAQACRAIVTLPHSQCPNLPKAPLDVFDPAGFHEVCEAYLLSSIEKDVDTWQRIVEGRK